MIWHRSCNKAQADTLHNVAKREKEHLNVVETSNESKDYDSEHYVIAPEALGGDVQQIPEHTSEKQKNLRDFLKTGVGKAAATGAGILAAGGLVFGGIKIGETGSPVNEVVAKPDIGKEVTIPPEATDFVNVYKDRYTDPLATYYSEVAYISTNPDADLPIGPDYLAGYNFGSSPNAAVSPLGFNILKLNPSQEINAQNSVAQFNGSIPTMNRFMNLLAKNPLPNQLAIVKDEFTKYTGFYNPYSQKLVDILASVVQKYGSSAIYKINEATIDPSADITKATIFDSKQPLIDRLDASGKIDAFNNQARLSISIEVYDNANQKTNNSEVIGNFQFSVMHAQSNDPESVGLIGIGAR